jgi:hypothetical protein
MCSPWTLKRFAQIHLEMQQRPTVLASSLSSRPLFMVDSHTCSIVDTDGQKYTVAGHTPKFDLPVSQWWPQLKLYVDKCCPQFDVLRELLSAIKQKPTLEWFDNGIRDGLDCSFYGVFGEETWRLGSDSTVNSDPAIHAFLSNVSEALKMHSEDLLDLHHPTIRCYNRHPMVELTPAQLMQREARSLFYGQEPVYTNGYDCADCHEHNTEAVVLHCKRCHFDLCPVCVAKRLM